MEIILVGSILIRLAALGWSILLMRRFPDWRMGFLAAMIALMAARQTLTLFAQDPTGQSLWTVELPGLAVSVMAFLAVYFLGSMLTERRRNEEHLRQAAKMEAVGRLAGGMAHDLNNVLTAILGYDDLLLERLPRDDRSLRLPAEEIQKAGKRAALLVQQLLAFSRRQFLQPRVLDLNALIGELHGMLRPLLGERIEVELDLAHDLAFVRADPGQLEQVLMNLAANARDAMPQGGRLTIATANVDRDGEFVRLTVRDTGAGMDASVRAKIFEPFYTTKGPGVGTGLGLATVHGIVQQSGGRITVESARGQGSTFSVFLPRVAGAPEPAAVANGAGPTAGGPETILLVEDEDLVRSMVSAFLEERGYRVLVAQTGEEALEVARVHRGAIDLLLVDVVLPGLDGPELARRLLVARPRLRVLLMSGYVHDSGRIAEGDAPVLPKPFTMGALAARVRETLEGAAVG